MYTALLLVIACKDTATVVPEVPRTEDTGADDTGIRDTGGPATPTGPSWVWARTFTGPTEEDEIDAVTAAPDGSVVITGKFLDQVTIEGEPVPLQADGAAADIPIARYAADGTLLWTKRFGSTGEDNVFAADTDADGNLYLSGIFTGTVDFGDDADQGAGILTSVGQEDMMVVSLDPAGDLRWAVRAGGPGRDGGNEIVVAPDGSLVVLAGSDGPFTAGPLSFVDSQARDAFVLRLDATTGAFLWGAQVAGPGEVRAKCLDVGPDGRIYAGGDQGLGANRVIADITVDLPTARQSDAFLLAFTPAGLLDWTRSWGGAGRDLCKGVAATDDGLFVTGEMEGDVEFGGTTLVTDGPDLFAWHLDTAGVTRWVHGITSPGALRGAEVVAHPDGGMVFGHRIPATTTLPSTAGPATVVEPTDPDGSPILVSYDAAGALRFVLEPEQAPGANLDELSVSGRRLYADLPIFEGSYTVGPATVVSGPSKDGLLVAVDL